jgi:membrane protease YdiL (CAAX protease family)
MVSVKIRESIIETENKAKYLLWTGFRNICVLTVIFLFVFEETAILGLTLDFNWINFFIALGIGSTLAIISIIVASSLMVKLQRRLKQTKTSEERERLKALTKFLIPKNALELVVWSIFLLFSAGFYEEIVFRGYLQNRLEIITGSLSIAVVLQALFLGILHIELGLKEMVNAAIGGIVMSFVFVFSGTLFAAVLMHFLGDLISTMNNYNARRKGELDKVIDKIFGKEFC